MTVLRVSALLSAVSLFSAGLVIAADRDTNSTPKEHDLKLWYDQPAQRWLEALPVGNGRLGAMVFGGIDAERIQLNEESVWAGPPFPENPEDLAPIIADARLLFFDGKPVEGQQLLQERLMAPRISPRSHQTLGDLHIRMIHTGRQTVDAIEITNWRRGAVTREHDPQQMRADFDDSEWQLVKGKKDLQIPEQSTVVFRATFELQDPTLAALLGQLELSPIDDSSVVYLNDKKIGETTEWNRSHHFDIGDALKPGVNLLAIAARNAGGLGHLAKTVRLAPKSNVPQTYRRSLDLDTAIVSTVYEVDGVTFRREVFTSYVDDVIAVRIHADRPGMISCDITLDRPADFKTSPVGDNRLLMKGRVSQEGKHSGVNYSAVLQADLEHGRVNYLDTTLQVRDANALTLLLVASTDYNFANPTEPLDRNLQQTCGAHLQSATGKPYKQLRRDHVADYQRLFRRVDLHLGKNKFPELPTDQKLRRVIDGETDPHLEALYFQLGRYLLICSSRPDTMPANLQGLWNEHVEAPWNADYHLNINIQMNYWPAEVTNLSECHLPMFDLMEGMMPDGRDLARKLGCRGLAFGHVSDAWLWSALQGQCVWGMWPMGAGWLSAHLMEHYRFTGDSVFLRKRAYPFLKETATFFLDWLVEDPQTQLLVSGPTTSPENTYFHNDQRVSLSMGTSMDQQIIWETFTNTLKAAELLKINDEFTQQVSSSLARLQGPQIGSDGRLMEWGKEYRDAEPGHRHMSHLYGLHPGFQMSMFKTPDLVAAARKTLETRLSYGGGHTGWSRAWLINFGARLLDGEFAHENLRLLLAKSTHPNLFDNHPPFQIDGNFGGTAGIAEMLLQSHGDQIHLLPALPEAWPQGHARGLCARGGFVVDVEWKEGKLIKAQVHSKLGHTCKLRYGGQVLELRIRSGETITLTKEQLAQLLDKQD